MNGNLQSSDLRAGEKIMILILLILWSQVPYPEDSWIYRLVVQKRELNWGWKFVKCLGTDKHTDTTIHEKAENEKRGGLISECQGPVKEEPAKKSKMEQGNRKVQNCNISKTKGTESFRKE